MAQKTRKPLTDEEREARRQAERELLAAAVEQLKTSEGWLRWLALCASPVWILVALRNTALLLLRLSSLVSDD